MPPKITLEIFKGALPLFVSVTNSCALVTLVFSFGKFIEVELKPVSGWAAMPVRATTWGLLGSEAVKVRLAVRFTFPPVTAAGWKITLMVQEPVDAGKFAPVQEFTPIVKSLALVPVIVGAVPEIVTADGLKLLTVIGEGPLGVPTFWLGKFKGLGLGKTTRFTAVPVKLTICAPNTLSVTVRTATRGLLVAVGENVMFTMQLPVKAWITAPTVHVVPAEIAYSVELAPLRPTVVSMTGPFEVFFRRTA